MRLVNCAAGVKCVFEPFNPTNGTRYPGVVGANGEGVEAGLEWGWGQGNGLKHVWHWSGWPFVVGSAVNERLLEIAVKEGVKVIVLGRRNRMQRAISVQISEQMQVWTPWTVEEMRRVKEHRFGTLDIGKLRSEMEGERANGGRAREVLERVGGSFVEVGYEELFGAEGAAEGAATMETRIEKVQGILEFLGAGRIKAPDRLILMRRLFDPGVTGFQNELAYGRIPNIAEVEGEFGQAVR